jgi:hypothetical protein
VNYTDAKGFSLLHHALRGGTKIHNVSTVVWLINHGADITEDLLLYALATHKGCLAKHQQLIDTLKEKFTPQLYDHAKKVATRSIQQQHAKEDTAALKKTNPVPEEVFTEIFNHFIRAFSSNLDMLQYICDLLTGKSSDFSAFVNRYAALPLAYATEHGLFETAMTLAHAGSPITESRERISNPLTNAAREFTLDQFKAFLAIAEIHGLKNNYKDPDGFSLLHYALQRAQRVKDSSTALWLIKNRATVTVSNVVTAVAWRLNSSLIKLLKSFLTVAQLEEAEKAINKTQKERKHLDSALDRLDRGYPTHGLELD